MDIVSMDKKYKTRDGFPVRIICLDRKGSGFPVVDLVMLPDGKETAHVWRNNGKFHEYLPHDDDRDLVEAV